MQQRTQQQSPRSRRLQKEKKKLACHFCVHAVKDIEYTETELLRRYTSSYGKIVPRRRSGVCAKHQRKLAHAIKRARVTAALPFVVR